VAARRLLEHLKVASLLVYASRPKTEADRAVRNLVYGQLKQARVGMLLRESSLSYLGVGVSLPTPTWGNVLQDARALLTRQPWAAVGPGVALATATLSLQLLADGLRDAFDPQQG